MSLLNVGARALQANQVALQTAGHNIANVNTPGYSRQMVALQTVQGQFTGSGYIGQGVDVQTILRNQSEILTRQATAAAAVKSADSTRADRLNQLQDIFSGGDSGLGAAINDMMNALSDVVSAPTDLTARTVALTRMDTTATRMGAASSRLDEIDAGVRSELNTSITALNNLTTRMAQVNEQIARATGNGQSPNDLLDQRDQLIRNINQYVQTTQIPADDGTVGLFVANQPIVLGTTATPLSVGNTQDFPGSGQLKLFFNQPGATPIEVDEKTLGGGSISGLLNFHNTDLVEGRNLLGRMALAIGATMNFQQTMGLALDGTAGKPLFATTSSVPGITQGSAVGSIDLTNATKFSPAQFVASDYEVRFTSPPGGQVIRLADGKVTNVADFTNPALGQIDGLTFSFTTSGALNERVLFKPFASAAGNMQALVHSPSNLAAANPVNAAMGAANSGSLQLISLRVTGQPNGALTLPPSPNPIPIPPATASGGVTLTFQTGPPAGYTISGTATAPLGFTGPYTPGTTVVPYTSGQPITLAGWQITLAGTPNNGDNVIVGNALDVQYGDWYKRDAGNASALLALRDAPLFDGVPLSDGYANAMAQVGTRTQSAQFAAQMSSTIAANLESDRTAVSGVNLDEEAAKLIQYQQAYQASAKMIQIAQNIFDSLIQTMGR